MLAARGAFTRLAGPSSLVLFPKAPLSHRPLPEIELMSPSAQRLPPSRKRWQIWACAVALGACAVPALAADLPISEQQRERAQQVAQAGVALSELADNAPDSHVVQRGDTLWDISKLFLKSPWRWPDLWGMNLEQIRNPHLIYPGQTLVLIKADGRAQLRLAGAPSAAEAALVPTNTVKVSPRIRPDLLENGAIASIPLQLIGPFLNEAVVFNGDELAAAPRVVATQEGRVMLSRGETAYVRGDLQGARAFRVFRQARPLNDPQTGQTLGYEGVYVGTADFVRAAENRPNPDGKTFTPVPASFTITSTRQEAGVGDRLSPVPQRDFAAFVPHAPASALSGSIISVYGEAVTAGQNQIVSINRGQRDGMERGHVLALWRAGQPAVDRTGEKRVAITLPDERVGMLFVFRVFDRVSYALILSALDPVRTGDRFSQP